MTNATCLYCGWSGPKDQIRLALIAIMAIESQPVVKERLMSVCPACCGLQSTLQKVPLEYATASEN